MVSTILNFISKNKVDRFKVRGFLLYLPTDWYHMTIGFCGDVKVEEYRTCKVAMILNP